MKKILALVLALALCLALCACGQEKAPESEGPRSDVAVTPIYETMREAWEDYRMLEALRRAGKGELLDELLKSYEGATDYADWENVPNHSDFQSLHDKALGAF